MLRLRQANEEFQICHLSTHYLEYMHIFLCLSFPVNDAIRYFLCLIKALILQWDSVESFHPDTIKGIIRTGLVIQKREKS